MFSRIRVQPTALLRRPQNIRYPIKHSTQALTTTASVRQNQKDHTPDSYSKEDDRTPPNDEKIHRVDPNSDLVQKPYEAPSGEWSRAGVKTDEYRMSKEGNSYIHQREVKVVVTRAGKTLSEDNGHETTKGDEGPDGKSSHGDSR